MRVKVLLVFLIIFLLLGGLAYTEHARNEELKDPKFVCEHYLKTYEVENYTLPEFTLELDSVLKSVGVALALPEEFEGLQESLNFFPRVMLLDVALRVEPPKFCPELF
ncbi:hypothetical protein BD01_2104 [Thermococcus nautili]|uniref:Uncharacterized protein n=1 Tax=Thermococcus nautili TaxID=195522 RepID=W8P818_9EURY|nr:hypothetical protein BD01_2104 [Thermococcus nautili]